MRRRTALTVVAAAGFVAAFVLLWLYDGPGEPGGIVLFAPFVALLGLEYGVATGAAAAALATALYLWAYDLAGGDVTWERAVGRLVPMIVLGAGIGWLGERLRERERSYRRIVDNSGEVIWIVDADGVMTFVNRRARDVLGYEPEELIGRRPGIQLEPADVTAARLERRKRGESDSYEIALRHKDGHTVWMHVIGTPMFDRAGRFVGGLGMASDVTARKAAEEALLARERALEEAQALAHIGSWEWDIAEDRITWSDELYRIFGLDPETFEASYEAYVACIHPDDRARANETVQNALASGEPFRFEHRAVRPDGEVRVLESRGTVFREGGARPTRMAGTGHDITERKAAEEELANARAEIARHDLARRQATELNDTVVQALVLAKYAIERSEDGAAGRAVDGALEHARRMVDDLLGEADVQPGQLRRAAAAPVGDRTERD